MSYEKNMIQTIEGLVITRFILSFYMAMYDKRAITLLHIFMCNQEYEIEKSTNSNRMMIYHKLL